MPRHDGVHDLKVASLLEPVSRAADANSVGMETVDGATLTFLVQTGSLVNAGFLAVVEEGDTLGGAYTAADALDVIGDTVGDDVDTVRRLGYTGKKKFARVALTITGATECGVVGVASELFRTPEADA
jgi:hypothetical protein